MPKRAQKIIRSTLQNKDIISVFHDVLGTGDNSKLNLSITYPKYLELQGLCQEYQRIIHMLSSSAVMEYYSSALEAYNNVLIAELETIFQCADFQYKYPPSVQAAVKNRIASYENVSDGDYETFEMIYNSLFDCPLISDILYVCKTLSQKQKSLSVKKELNGGFLLEPSLFTFCPLSARIPLDFKQIYIAASPENQRFILLILHKLLNTSHIVYNVVTRPDVDVDEFVNIVLQSLDGVEKRIPRCKEAFARLRDSVKVLKDNFPTYYTDYIVSGKNPTLMMEYFVADVSRTAVPSLKLKQQFRTIISFYKKEAVQNTDPRLKGLFTQIDKNFTSMDNESNEQES